MIGTCQLSPFDFPELHTFLPQCLRCRFNKWTSLLEDPLLQVKGQWGYCVAICSKLKHSLKAHETNQLTKAQENPEIYAVHKAPPQGYRGSAPAGEWRPSRDSWATTSLQEFPGMQVLWVTHAGVNFSVMWPILYHPDSWKKPYIHTPVKPNKLTDHWSRLVWNYFFTLSPVTLLGRKDICSYLRKRHSVGGMGGIILELRPYHHKSRFCFDFRNWRHDSEAKSMHFPSREAQLDSQHPGQWVMTTCNSICRVSDTLSTGTWTHMLLHMRTPN